MGVVKTHGIHGLSEPTFLGDLEKLNVEFFFVFPSFIRLKMEQLTLQAVAIHVAEYRYRIR